MPLILENETFPERPILVVIAGTPFSYKTSIAITSSKAMLIDGEFGAERAKGRVPTFRISNGWGEIDAEIQNGMLEKFDTVVLDTAKAILDDHLWEYALTKNYTTNKQKTFGDVADYFKKLVGKIRNSKKDIVVVSHEKSKDENDARIYDLDITGGSKQLLLRMADQVGFAYKDQVKGNNGAVVTQTIITFNPKKEWPFCKNVAGLADIIIPHYTKPEWSGFFDREVIQPTKKAISAMSEEQVKTLEAVSEWQASILATTPQDDANFGNTLMTLFKDISTITEEHIKVQVRAYFQAHIKNIGWKWQKEPAPGAFVAVEEKPPVVDAAIPPADQTAADADKRAENTAPPVEEKAAAAGQPLPEVKLPAPSTPSLTAAEPAQGDELFKAEQK